MIINEKIRKMFDYTIKEFKKNKFFWLLVIFIFILQMITYPSIHDIGDEKLYLDVAKKLCKLDFSYFVGERETTVHQPLYFIILCITSPIHNLVLGKAEIITYMFFVLLVVGWYFSIPNSWKVDKKKFALLLFSNNLLWIYSVRVLLDVPIAFFLSLGMLHLFLFFEYNKRRNYYLSFLFLLMAILIKESALAFVPIFAVYLLLKKNFDYKKWLLLLLPCVPWIIFVLYQYFSGFPVLWLFGMILKSTSTLTWQRDVPYVHLPTIFFMAGFFGPGIILCILKWKNALTKKEESIRNFVLFFLVLYLLWEFAYDFILYGNLPRYHTTLIPLFALTITKASDKSKWMKYLFYLTLIYSLATGFIAAYYFHINTQAIWQVSIKKILNIN